MGLTGIAVQGEGLLVTAPATTATTGTATTDTASISAVRTVCSYCGVGCGMVLDVAIDPRRAPAGAEGVRRQGAPGEPGRLCTKGATSADMLAAPGRLTQRAGPRRPRRRAGGRRRGRRRSAVRPGGCARSLDEHGPGRGRALRVRPDDAGGAVPGEQAGQGLRAAPTRSSRTRGCAWPARAAATSCRSAPTGRPAPTRTSTTPTSSSSSAPTWPTATRSCSCG